MTASQALVMDASVWVSALLSQDLNHFASRRWLDGWLQSTNRLHAPVLILSEVAGAVDRRTQDANRGHRAAARLRRVPRIQFVPIDEALADDAAGFAADLGLRGADAVITNQDAVTIRFHRIESAIRAHSAVASSAV